MNLLRIVCAFICSFIVSTIHIDTVVASDRNALSEEIFSAKKELSSVNKELLSLAEQLRGTKHKAEFEIISNINDISLRIQTALDYERELLYYQPNPSHKKKQIQKMRGENLSLLLDDIQSALQTVVRSYLHEEHKGIAYLLNQVRSELEKVEKLHSKIMTHYSISKLPPKK